MSRADRAAPFIAAAVAGLCAQPKTHDPVRLAASAVEIGLAVDARIAEMVLGAAGGSSFDSAEAPPDHFLGARGLDATQLRGFVCGIIEEELSGEPAKPVPTPEG